MELRFLQFIPNALLPWHRSRQALRLHRQPSVASFPWPSMFSLPPFYPFWSFKALFMFWLLQKKCTYSTFNKHYFALLFFTHMCVISTPLNRSHTEWVGPCLHTSRVNCAWYWEHCPDNLWHSLMQIHSLKHLLLKTMVSIFLWE